MKKRMMAAIVAVAVMMFGTTAFAAGSPVAGSTTADTKVADGQVAATTVVAPTETPEQMLDSTKVATDHVISAAVAKTTVDEAVVEAKNILTDVKGLGDKLGDKTIAAAATDKNKTVSATVLSVVNLTSQVGVKEITLKNTAIKAGKTYAVLHYTANGWVTIPATVKADGELTFPVDEFSAFAIVEINVADKAATPATKPAANDKKADGAASPKTGETIPVAVFAMLVCATGVVVCARKKEN